MILVGRKRHVEQTYRSYGDFTTTHLLLRPSCRGAIRVIAIIEDQEVIHKILTYLGLRQIKVRPRPVAHGLQDLAVAPFDDWPAPIADDYLTDPLYPDEV